MVETEFITDRQIYERVLQEQVPNAKDFVWIGTSDIKDLHVDSNRRMVPFLKVLSDLIKKQISIRLIHAKEPGPRFRKDFDRFPELVENERFERILCPRMHMKVFIVDGRMAYVGSANLTGAGIGAKSPKRRNFEAGMLTDDRGMINELMAELDELYLGNHCVGCGRRDVCPDPIA